MLRLIFRKSDQVNDGNLTFNASRELSTTRYYDKNSKTIDNFYKQFSFIHFAVICLLPNNDSHLYLYYEKTFFYLRKMREGGRAMITNSVA